jgi:hypothetical protein
MFRLRLAGVLLSSCTALAVCSGTAPAQAPAAPDAAVAKPEWAYAHDLKIRKGKETDWEKSLKLGVEVFKYPAYKANIVLTSSGSLAVIPEDALPNKKAEWATGLSFSVRTADEEKFTKDTALYGAEIYKNAFSGAVLYLSEKNSVGVLSGTAEANKEPQFLYGFKLKARKPGIQSFEKEAKAYGLEAYRDNSTGGLVYITEAGNLAVVKGAPEKAPETKDVKKPKPLYGLEPKVRKVGEPEFTDKTTKISIEVFKDENSGNLIYITDAGVIAAVPAPEGMKTDGKLPWVASMELRARPGGEPDFAKANKYSIEVFEDKNTNYLLFVSSSGSIAVLPRK